ncbi:hypothetical protein XENOCAPTIV_025235, partial [Xenoophorus captivus]
LRQLSLFTVTAEIAVMPWGMLGAEVPWRRLTTVAAALTRILWPDGKAPVRGRVVRRYYGVRTVQTPGGPVTHTSIFKDCVLLPTGRPHIGGMWLGWLPEWREVFPLPVSFWRR